MTNRTKMSITTTLSLVIGTLAVVVIACGAVQLCRSWSFIDKANRVDAAARASDELFEDLQSFRMERGNIITAALSPEPIVSPMLESIKRDRARSDAAYGRGLQMIADHPWLVPAELLDALQRSHDAVQNERSLMDDALSGRGLTRDAVAIGRWPGVTQTYLDRLARMSDAVERSVQDIDPQVDRLYDIKRQIWFARVKIGGSVILPMQLALASGQVVSDKTFESCISATGEVTNAWGSALSKISTLSDASAFAATIDAARPLMTGDLADQRRRVLGQMHAHGASEITMEQFRQTQSAGEVPLVAIASLAMNKMVDVAARARLQGLHGLILSGLLMVIAVLIVAIGLLLTQRRVVRPVKLITSVVRRLAEHDLQVSIPDRGFAREIAQIAAALGVFKDNMIRADELAAAQEAERAAKEHRAQALEKLVNGFEAQIASMVGMLASASTELEATAKEMSVTVERTGQQSGVVADAARAADNGVQSVAAAAEELSASIREITQQVATSAQQANTVAESTKRTDVVVNQLAEASGRVGQIVELISSIAAQTNLLALNATIEAARAGEAGKGFAVVASEVKSLAQQTAKATEGVSEQVAQIRAATEAAMGALVGITSGIGDISRSSVMIAAAVEEQGAATGEIARNVQQTAGSTRTVTDNIFEISLAAQNNGAAATQVMASAGELSRQAEALNQEVAQFLRLVKGA